ncbi:hypothetical protein P5V15_002662 [Pogonomyrmex californicus]
MAKRSNWIEVFNIVKVQRTPITYLLEDYRGKSVARTFYEHDLHRATNPDVYLVDKVLRRKETRFTSSDWDLMDHIILEYTRAI